MPHTLAHYNDTTHNPTPILHVPFPPKSKSYSCTRDWKEARKGMLHFNDPLCISVRAIISCWSASWESRKAQVSISLSPHFCQLPLWTGRLHLLSPVYFAPNSWTHRWSSWRFSYLRESQICLYRISRRWRQWLDEVDHQMV